MITTTAQAFSIEAEQSVLGALMLHPEAIDRIDVDLQPEHFFRSEHRAIFTAIRALAGQGKSADALAVCDELERTGELERAGGMADVIELAGAASSAAGIKRHAELVVDRAMLRGLQSAGDKIFTLAQDGSGKTTIERIDEAQRIVMSLSDSATLGAREPQKVGDLLPDYLRTIMDRRERKGGGISTGFPDLDRRLNGGLQDGSLVVIAGRPAMGKTALALMIAEHFADIGHAALVCSQEMQTVQLIDRTCSFKGGIDLSAILSGELSAEQHDRLAATVQRIKSSPLFLDEQGALRIGDVRRKARQVARRQALKLIVIDYLQLMVGDGENRTRELTIITGELKALAKELNCTVLALSQLNRSVEQRPNKRPIMSDLRESGSIEQDADIILAPYRDEYYNEESVFKGLAELLVLKNRQGPSGGFVPLGWRGCYTRFESLVSDVWPEAPKKEQGTKQRRGFKA